ncbi:LVIVD repeat-containing protein [Bdellovibrio bacteriovorus]|uniref:LVIVD repeat-containing protein n=1 Tax=Bdellovibrio bacteriovorus TaxID=959 RepID=UPI003AA97D4C
MRTFLKKSILVVAFPLLTSCGLVNAELFLPKTLDLGSSEPPAPLLPPPPPPAVLKQDAWGYGGTIFDVAISGSHILAGTSRGISIYDVSSPYSPAEVNLLKSYKVNKVSQVGTQLFVSYNNGILELYDITTASSPTLQSSLTLTNPYRAATQGTIAYIPDGTSGLRVVDFSDPDNMQLVTTVDTNGTAVSAQIDGGFLYLADKGQGIKIFNLASPTAPTLLGSYVTGGDAMDIKVKGNYAYVAVQWNSLDIIDISNKAAPALSLSYMDYFNYNSGYQQLEIRGDTLMAMDYYNGLISFDISNPINPVVTGGASTFATLWWGLPYGFISNSTHLFVASETYGLGAIDISSPEAPHIPYTYRVLESWTNSVDAGGTRAFICENNWGRLTVVDISDPSKPLYLGETPQGVSACTREIIYDNNYVYATVGNNGMKVISVSNPASPAVVATIDSGSNARKLMKSGNFVYVVYSSFLYIYNVTTPTAPTLAGSYAYSAEDVFVEGNYAYLAGPDTLRIVNISNPASPALTGTYNYPTGTRTTYSVVKNGNYVFVGGNENMGVIDVSNPATPTLAYKNSGSYVPENMVVLNNKLYTCNYNLGAKVYDITTPTLPTLLEAYHLGGCLGIQARDGNILIADETMGLKILNDASKPYMKINKPNTIMSLSALETSATRTYLSDSSMGLIVLDNSTPEQPTYLTRIELNAISAPPAEDGTTLYVSDQFLVKAFDMTDPKNPVVLSQAARIGTGYLNDIVKVGNILYVRESNSSLNLYDATNPASLTALTSHPVANIRHITHSGNLLLAASQADGLRVISLSTPTNPTVIGTYNSPGTAVHSVVDGNMVYVADSGSGLQIVSIADPNNPVAVGNYNTPGTAQMVAKKGNYVFVSDAGHVEVVDVTNPAAPTLKRTINKSEFGGWNAKGVSVQGDRLYIQLYNGYEVFDISDMDNIHQ